MPSTGSRRSGYAQLSQVIGHIEAKGLDRSRALGRATARYGLLQAEATIAWTKEVQALLDELDDDPV